MSVRTSILRKIRASLEVPEADDPRQATAAKRLADRPRGIIPKRSHLPLSDRIALFTAQAEKIDSTVARIASAQEAPLAIADYLRGRNLPPAVRMGSDPRLEALPWTSAPTLEITKGASDGSDLTGLSHAFGGVAETGTLILTSGGNNPTTLNFLPENHIIIVAAEDITGDMETIWDRLRAYYGDGIMPRAVNMITGPSRSGDIEQKILLGAHGPKDLHIVVIG